MINNTFVIKDQLFTILAHIGRKPLYSAQKPSARTVLTRQSNDDEYKIPLVTTTIVAAHETRSDYLSSILVLHIKFQQMAQVNTVTDR